MGRVITTEPVVRILVRFAKEGPASYMGHLDLLRNFQRAARRAGIPLAYSQGFNPHPRMTFASPLPVGAAGLRELAGFDLVTRVDAEEVMERLNATLPAGISVQEAWPVPPARGTFGTLLYSQWRVSIRFEEDIENLEEGLQQAVQDILASETLMASRGKGPKDVRPFLRELTVCASGCESQLSSRSGRTAVLEMTTIQDGDYSAKPQDVVEALSERMGAATIVSVARLSLVPDRDIGAGDTRSVAYRKQTRERGGDMSG